MLSFKIWEPDVDPDDINDLYDPRLDANVDLFESLELFVDLVFIACLETDTKLVFNSESIFYLAIG